MIDCDGYRLNVGIVICNKQGQVLWARRYGQRSWQFPQGGINEEEYSEDAMYRELCEETGLAKSDVTLLSATEQWLCYKLPKKLVRWETEPVCIGQKQKWFLLQLISNDNAINMQHSDKPEFDGWRWVNYWYPVRHVVAFKREVYRQVMKEFGPIILSSQENPPPRRVSTHRWRRR